MMIMEIAYHRVQNNREDKNWKWNERWWNQ